MPTPTVQAAAASDADRVVATLVLAFGADPATWWAFPEPAQYLTYFPQFMRPVGGRAFDHASAHYAEGHTGAALWLPPGVGPDEAALGALFERGTPEPLRQEVFAVLERLGAYQLREPHWYLPLIGVDPGHQRQGIGSALLGHALARCDRDGTLAYLESSNPANIPLYERHGFAVVGTIQGGASPPFWMMVRRLA